MDLIEFYESLLGSIGLTIDSTSGNVGMVVGDKNVPFTVSGKNLVVPYRSVLQSADWNQVIGFHPISENSIRSESAVLKKLRAMITWRITEVTTLLMHQIMSLAADNKNQERLPPSLLEVLEVISDVDAKTVTALNKVIDVINPVGEHRLVSIYLKKSGKYRGEKYSRVAVCNFPLAETFTDGEDMKIFNVKMTRKKDKKMIAALFNYLLPDNDDLDEYSYGSNNMLAPYFHALCHSFAKVAKQLNSKTKLFKKYLDDADSMMIDLSWVKELDDLSKYNDIIPPLEGNKGNDSEESSEPKATNSFRSNTAQSVLSSSPKPATEPVAPTVTPPAPIKQNSPTIQSVPNTPSATTNSNAAETGKLSWNTVVQNQRQNSYGNQQIPTQPLQQPTMNAGYPTMSQQPMFQQQPIDPRMQAQSQYDYNQSTAAFSPQPVGHTQLNAGFNQPHQPQPIYNFNNNPGNI